jgi:DNA recombination protein RmuC
MDTNTIILIGIFIIALVILILNLRRKDVQPIDISKDLNEIFPQVLKNANEQLVLMANQKLDAEKKEISSDLTNKKEAIEKLVKQVLEELNKNSNKLEVAEKERVGTFAALKQEIENQKKLTEQLSVTTEGLKNVLSNNQLRGQFGEQIAEDLLKMSGFVRGTDYDFNKEQAGSETRPDFTVFMPDGTRINVDAKFPYNNLKKYVETDDKGAKSELLKLFSTDIKNKIKQVTTRNYINPEDKTVDFVILFIPNEMIFSFIYDKLNDIWVDGIKNKVVMAGPFSFTAILRMVRQAYSNFKYQENTHKIITYIKEFEIQFLKYNEEFTKIGEKIKSVSEQYDRVNSTRTNQLTKVIDKIKLEDQKATIEVTIEKEQTKTTIGLDL